MRAIKSVLMLAIVALVAMTLVPAAGATVPVQNPARHDTSVFYQTAAQLGFNSPTPVSVPQCQSRQIKFHAAITELNLSRPGGPETFMLFGQYLGHQPKCTVYGYPNVTAWFGHRVGNVAVHVRASYQRFEMTPGSWLHAVIHFTGTGKYPEATCRPFQSNQLRIVLPGEGSARYIGFDRTFCSGNVNDLYIRPFKPGDGLAV